MKKRTRIPAFVLVLVILVLVFRPSQVTEAKKVTSALIEQKQDEIDKTEQQIKDIKSNKSKAEQILKKLKSQKTDLKAYIAEIDAAMEDVQGKIDSLSAQITAQQALVDETRIELEESIERERKQYADMLNRIRFMYENGSSTIVEILFSAKSFSDFLTRAEYVSQVTDYDREVLNDYRATTELVEITKVQLEAEEVLLEEAKLAQEEELATLAALTDAKRAELDQMETDIDMAQDAVEEYEADLKAMKETIEALEKEIAAEKKRLIAANEKVMKYDGGKFIWPIAKYTRITSPYGYRIHPTLHTNLFHNGIDIASPYGTDIYASYDGKVVAAAYTSTMGNYIMIDHGDGIYTVYMHCSKLYVKSGAIVVAGETIAAVGSTGRSTGNHLHFSVRVNGEYVSPWNYVSEP